MIFFCSVLKRRIPVILNTHDLSTNDTKKEVYEILKPSPPTTIEELIKYKNDKIFWSELDWLVNYKPPPPPKDETPDWTYFKVLGSLIDTEADFKRRKILAMNSLEETTTYSRL